MRTFTFRNREKLLLLLLILISSQSNSQSLRFTDTSFVSIEPFYTFNLRDFTIEAWIKIEGYGSTTETDPGGLSDVVPIISKGLAENENTGKEMNYFLGYRQSDMKLVADFEDSASSANHPVISNASLPFCTWTHVAASYNTATDTWKLYVNGSLDKTLALGENYTPQFLSWCPAYVGSTLNTATSTSPGFFNGRIDEVRIWNIVRTDGAILTNYKSELTAGIGLVGRWSFNENDGGLLINSAGIGPGFARNSPMWVSGFNQTDAVTNSSVSLNGRHDYISFGKADGSAGNPNLNTTSFTLEAWIKIDGNGISTTTSTGGITAAIPIIAKGRDEGETPANINVNYFLGIDTTNKIVADFEESSGLNHPVTGTASIPTGVWTHIAASYGAGEWNLYINGIVDKTESENGGIPLSNSIQHASVGSALNSAGVPEGFFNGKIDEIRIWSVVRTASEISGNYLNTITSGTGLLGRWGLNENCNNSANNSVAGGATGTLMSTNTTTHPTNGGPFWYSEFNPAPNIPSNPNPSNGSGAISKNVTLCTTVSDPYHDALRVRIYGRQKTVSTGEKFSIIWLPDVQYYTSQLNGGTNAIFQSQINWIVANKTNLNIAFVGQLGDCTEHGDNNDDDIEWKRADTTFKIIEDPATTGLIHGIPYGVAVGEHDQGLMGAAGDPNAPTNFYNQYFGEARFNGKTYYGGHHGINNDNHYQLFSASGIDFIAISLEYDPFTAPSPMYSVLGWANNLLKLYPNRKGIIYSHYILNADGSFGNQGNDTYNYFKSNPNLILMVCGHVPGESRRSDTFDGRTVHSVLADYQSTTNGGNGFLRIFEFDPKANTIGVKTYSPWTNQYETDANSQFVLNSDFTSSGNFALVGENTNVSSGSQTCVNWSNLSFEAQYEWYVEVFDGENTTVSPVWNFTTPAGAPLPVSLIEFKAMPEKSKVKLAWKTSREENSDHFEIERSSNGIDFQKMGTVAGAGNSNQTKNYSFADDQPLNGKSFYRLKMVDDNNTHKYSHIEAVNLSAKKTVDVYPNPSRNNSINLVLSSALQGELSIKLYDMNGKLHLNQKQIINSSTLTISHQLPAGIYMLDANANGFSEKKKIVIQ
jgi:hypothetical protein